MRAAVASCDSTLEIVRDGDDLVDAAHHASARPGAARPPRGPSIWRAANRCPCTVATVGIVRTGGRAARAARAPERADERRRSAPRNSACAVLDATCDTRAQCAPAQRRRALQAHAAVEMRRAFDVLRPAVDGDVMAARRERGVETLGDALDAAVGAGNAARPDDARCAVAAGVMVLLRNAGRAEAQRRTVPACPPP